MIGYGIDETTGFPQDYKFATVKGSVIVPTTLESNVLKLHQFLYGNTNYTPTEDVLNKSAQITTVAGGGEAQSTSPAATEAPGTTTDDSYTRILHIPMITAATTVITATIRITVIIRITAAVIIPITVITRITPVVETIRIIPVVETTRTIPVVEMMLEVIIPQKIPVAIPAAVRIFQTENKKEIIN